jgi:hypothetical protein
MSSSPPLRDVQNVYSPIRRSLGVGYRVSSELRSSPSTYKDIHIYIVDEWVECHIPVLEQENKSVKR